MNTMNQFLILCAVCLCGHGCSTTKSNENMRPAQCESLLLDKYVNSHKYVDDLIRRCGSINDLAINGSNWRSLPNLRGVSNLTLYIHGRVDTADLCYKAPALRTLTLGASTSLDVSLGDGDRICDGRVLVQAER